MHLRRASGGSAVPPAGSCSWCRGSAAPTIALRNRSSAPWAIPIDMPAIRQKDQPSVGAFQSDPARPFSSVPARMSLKHDAPIVGDEDLVVGEQHGNAAGPAHPGDVPVVEESELPDRHLDRRPGMDRRRRRRCSRGSYRAPRVSRCRTSRGHRRRSSLRRRRARPREAGKWLEPATRGPDPLGPVDLLEDTRGQSRPGSSSSSAGPDRPAARAVPLRHLGDHVELLATESSYAAELRRAPDVERAGSVEVGDGLVGEAAGAFGLQGALAQGGPSSRIFATTASAVVGNVVSASATMPRPLSAARLPGVCGTQRQLHVAGMIGPGVDRVRGAGVVALVVRAGRDSRRRDGWMSTRSRQPSGSPRVLGLSPTSTATISPGFSGA